MDMDRVGVVEARPQHAVSVSVRFLMVKVQVWGDDKIAMDWKGGQDPANCLWHFLFLVYELDWALYCGHYWFDLFILVCILSFQSLAAFLKCDLVVLVVILVVSEKVCLKVFLYSLCVLIGLSSFWVIIIEVNPFQC